MVGTHPIAFWSKVQKRVALSTAEAELYAAVYAARQVVGVEQLAKDLGIPTRPADIMIDAKATIAILLRKGLGSMKHVRIRWDWIYDGIKAGDFSVVKVSTLDNIADAFTKPSVGEPENVVLD